MLENSYIFSVYIVKVKYPTFLLILVKIKNFNIRFCDHLFKLSNLRIIATFVDYPSDNSLTLIIHTNRTDSMNI